MSSTNTAPSFRIDQDIRRWLTTCPSSDQNFKSALKRANLDTLWEALKSGSLSDTARKQIERRMIQLERQEAATLPIND